MIKKVRYTFKSLHVVYLNKHGVIKKVGVMEKEDNLFAVEE